MQNHEWLARQFEGHREHLRSVAYRMLGSLSEADDAVQAAWINLSRADTSEVDNLGGWLTTVVARVSLDMLRSRKSQREEPLEAEAIEPIRDHNESVDPEREALLADSVGLALLVVLDTLKPDERLTFVLHDVFAMPFEEIAPIVGHTPDNARQIASRARKRVRGMAALPPTDISRQREVVNAFLTAARGGDFEGLLAVLDPDVVIRADGASMPGGKAWEMQGAQAVAKQFSRKGSAQGVQPVLINGVVGAVVAPRGRLKMLLNFTIVDGKIVEISSVADPEQVSQTEIAVLDD
jgi:RNA polymerase sigma-70 factor (ECF subfamily)